MLKLSLKVRTQPPALSAASTSFDGQYYTDDALTQPYYTDDAQTAPLSTKD